ncbi:conserved hypothetical protein [Candidatus Nitrospira nitrosa]|uniref:FRG domain-containing protein n=1 Tax=Candidatus Nitrospira nitrosa TaxID=1742972 RepID=A0A0S4LNH3_9BACT|nr:FRG domain-containing protein [Candidatus Nitrospira nitrosa]CUS37462.1 conserved hypothetical protein [Candidatus Nitrospira nitrosa]
MRLPGTETIVNSWAELVGELHSREIIPVREDEGGHLRSPYVFRGADSAKWPLETSIVRLPGFIPSNSKTVERSLIRSFRKYAKAGTFDDKSEWYVLAVAQHNGLPTRCLDWCASPFVAAHFACGDETRKLEDGVIWCLHAGALRAINREHHQSTRTLDRVAWVYDTRLLESQFRDLDALDASYEPQQPSTRLMLLWEPPSLDDRIANQSGMLTIMNSATGSQNSFLADYSAQHAALVHRIVIAAAVKPEIRAMLDQNNISERTLFPGLPGLCAWLKRYYAKAW